MGGGERNLLTRANHEQHGPVASNLPRRHGGSVETPQSRTTILPGCTPVGASPGLQQPRTLRNALGGRQRGRRGNAGGAATHRRGRRQTAMAPGQIAPISFRGPPRRDAPTVSAPVVRWFGTGASLRTCRGATAGSRLRSVRSIGRSRLRGGRDGGCFEDFHQIRLHVVRHHLLPPGRGVDTVPLVQVGHTADPF